jgi:hypothetical protein
MGMKCLGRVVNARRSPKKPLSIAVRRTVVSIRPGRSTARWGGVAQYFIQNLTPLQNLPPIPNVPSPYSALFLTDYDIFSTDVARSTAYIA